MSVFLFLISQAGAEQSGPEQILPVLPTPSGGSSTTESPDVVIAVQAGPRIQFAELVHDFGKLESGTVAKHEFVFTNTGNATLEITSVRTSCGCTTTGAYDTRVEPGKTGRIPLQFNTAGFSGPVTKTATVTCNAPGQETVVLQLKALVWRPIEITPMSVYFNVPAETFTNETRVVRIVNNLDTPLTLSDLTCTNSAFKAELATLKEGQEFELRVTLREPLSSGFVHSSVSLRTSSTNTPSLTIPIYAYVQPVIVTSPSLISLPPGPLASPVTRSLTIRNTGTNALVLTDPSINIDGATVTLREIQTGKVFSVTVNFPAGLQLQATQQVEVRLKSNHPKVPFVKVPVTQPARAPSQVSVTSSTARPPKPAVRTIATPSQAAVPPAPPQPPPVPARPRQPK